MKTGKIIALGGLGLGLATAALISAQALTGGHSNSAGPAPQGKPATTAQAASANPNPQTPAAAATAVLTWWNGIDANGNPVVPTPNGETTMANAGEGHLGSLAYDAGDNDANLNTWASQGYPTGLAAMMEDSLTGGFTNGWQNDISNASADEPPAVDFKGFSAQDGLIGLYNQYLNDSTMTYDDLTQATSAGFNGNAQEAAASAAAFASDYQKLNNAGQGLALAINSVAGMAVTSDSGFPNWDAYASSASPSPALPQLPNT